MFDYVQDWSGIEKMGRPVRELIDLSEEESKVADKAAYHLAFYFAAVYMDEGYTLGVYVPNPEEEITIKGDLTEMRKGLREAVAPYLNTELSETDLKMPGFCELSGI